MRTSINIIRSYFSHGVIFVFDKCHAISNRKQNFSAVFVVAHNSFCGRRCRRRRHDRYNFQIHCIIMSEALKWFLLWMHAALAPKVRWQFVFLFSVWHASLFFMRTLCTNLLFIHSIVIYLIFVFASASTISMGVCVCVCVGHIDTGRWSIYMG